MNSARVHARLLALVVAVMSGLATSASRADPQAPAPTPPARPTGGDPSHDEMLSNPALDDAIAEQRRARADRAPLKPRGEKGEEGGDPGIGAPETSASPGGRELWNSPTQWKGRAVPEGAFLATRDGVLVRTKAGDAAFVPARGADVADSAREAPMVILPNQRLAQLDAALGTSAEARRVRVSGQVFTYRSRGYLSLTAFSLVTTGKAGDGPSDASAKTATPASTSTPAGEDDRRVREMLAELEERRGMPRALDASNLAVPADGLKGLKAPEHVLAEGTVLSRRRARLVRGAVGAVLAFDNDPNSPGLGAMPILPCRMMEHMENVTSQHGEDLVFVVSGRVSTYQGRNYVLPTMYQVVRPSDLSSAQ